MKIAPFLMMLTALLALGTAPVFGCNGDDDPSQNNGNNGTDDTGQDTGGEDTGTDDTADNDTGMDDDTGTGDDTGDDSMERHLHAVHRLYRSGVHRW